MFLNKSIIAYILIVVLIIAPLPIFSADETYSGVTAGGALIKNASFTDIGSSPYAEDIMKMSVYSVVREYGSSSYRPGQSATKQDMLAALVRAVGRQEEAVRQGELLKLADPTLSPVNAYLMGHIEVAGRIGIINQNEITAVSSLTAAETAAAKAEADKAKKANWKMTLAQYNQLLKQKLDQRAFDKAYKSPVNREEAALWIARALNFQPVTGEEIKNVFNYKDWNAIKTENLPYIEEVLKRGIMKGTTANNFSPKGNISRGEMAAILNAVTSLSLDSLDCRTGFGKVAEVSIARDFQTPTDTYTTNIVIETSEAASIDISIRKKSGGSVSNEEAIPSIKNGKIGSESLVAEGDIVEYTLTKDNKVLLLQVARLNELDGTFIVYDPQKNTVQMADKSNNLYYLRVMPDTVIKAQNEPVEIGRIEPNSAAKAIFANNMLKSLSIEMPPELISGEEKPVKILYADTLGRVIKVSDEYDNKQYLDLADNAAVYINGQLQGIDSIGFDQDAVVRTLNGKVYEVSIFTDVQEEEYNRVQIITAHVRDVTDKGITLITDANPEQPVLYTFDSATPIIKDKMSVSASVLRQGDRVKLEVNSANDRHIVRMEVQGEGILVEKVYKGDIKDVIPETGELILSNVYSYGYYDWVKKNGYIKYKLSDNAEIYNKDNKLDKYSLEDYIGKTLYAVSKKNYGTEELVKAVLKDGYEDTLYKSISDIKWTTRQMTLSDGRIMNFHNGSIIIKDGRLLDSVYLSKYSGAFVIQNRSASGTGSAPVISLDSFNAFSNYRITKGYLHNMGEDYYTVENSYTISNNDWNDSGEETFLLTDESYVYDNVFVNGAITVDKFLESRYKPYTYTWPNYKTSGKGKDFHEDDEYHYNYDKYKNSSKYHEHCLIYAVTDENGFTQAINIYKKDKESFKDDKRSTERMTAGQVNSVDVANDVITIKNGRDYSTVYGEWRPVMANMPVGTEKVVVLKEGKQISLSEVNPGDSIYILSQDGKALFIFIEP